MRSKMNQLSAGKSDTDRRISRPLVIGGMAGLALALTGCGVHGSTEAPATVAQTTVAPNTDPPLNPKLSHPETTDKPAQKGPATFHFDSHGGNPIIKVYPGPTYSAEDTNAHGSAYTNGEEVRIECETEGRDVNGHTDWYKLDDQGPHFAPGAYGHVLGAEPPHC